MNLNNTCENRKTNDSFNKYCFKNIKIDPKMIHTLRKLNNIEFVQVRSVSYFYHDFFISQLNAIL